MNDAGQVTLTSKPEMGAKNATLHLTWREHTKIIEAELTNRHYLRLTGHFTKLCFYLLGIGYRIVWVYTDTRKYTTWMRFCKSQRGPTRCKVTPRVNHACHTTCNSSLNYGFTISIKAGCVDVCMAIDEHVECPFQQPCEQKEVVYSYLKHISSPRITCFSIVDGLLQCQMRRMVEPGGGEVNAVAGRYPSKSSLARYLPVRRPWMLQRRRSAQYNRNQQAPF